MNTDIKHIFYIAFLFLFASVVVADAVEITGKCVGVADGDTCTILCDGNMTAKIRFYGIDCPESGQDFGKKAKTFTSSLIFGKTLKVNVIDTDKYGRNVGKVYCGNTYVNLEIVKAGFAWHYASFARGEADLAEAERNAQKNKLGLWSQPNPTAPWEYRKMTKHRMVPVDTSKITIEGPFWVSRSGKIHNKYCEAFAKAKNKKLVDNPAGVNCKMCGGAGDKALRR